MTPNDTDTVYSAACHFKLVSYLQFNVKSDNIVQHVRTEYTGRVTRTRKYISFR